MKETDIESYHREENNLPHLSNKQLIKRIQKSESYEECSQEIMFLMKRLGVSESYQKCLEKEGIGSYHWGMWIAKAFDIMSAVPKMRWLPYSIRKMYM